MSEKKADHQKIAVITGANSGIGKVTARELAKKGYRIIMICRNQEKAERAKQEIIFASENRDVDYLLCNLDRMDEIRETAGKISEMLPTLDLLVNNAGIVADSKRETTEDGFEVTFAVNHLAYFLLTKELLPLLHKAESVRVVNVASEAHRAGKFDPDNLQLSKGYGTVKAYGNSKLFNIMFTRELAKRLEGSGVTTYSLHPGAVSTNLASDSSSLFGWLFNMGKMFMLSPDKGAKTTIWLSVAEGIEGKSGGYFKNSKEVKPSRIAQDDQACRQLWTMTEELLGEFVEVKSSPFVGDK
ncbi:MAG: SDR family oxidoreductase [Balneolaceae bacterium]|nr:SDR family oxidoreductase [Balneolaceae bacterium]